MVEMQELSNILHSASEDSLVILDEVGRGTATYDGISIAWAATEYLSAAQSVSPSPKVLFATHYHELTALAEHVDGVANVHVAAEEREGEVTFLRTVRDGPADRSYGIHVAQLAGVPDPVVSRARDVLRRLREEKAVDVRGGDSGDGGGDTRQAVFDLGSGQFRMATSADGGRTGGADAGSADASESERAADGEDEAERDPATESVLEALRGVDVTETPPVELMAKVQAWQAELSEGGEEE
jgi:DNA mismatch repair protein MutS